MTLRLNPTATTTFQCSVPNPNKGEYYDVSTGKVYKNLQELRKGSWFDWTFKILVNSGCILRSTAKEGKSEEGQVRKWVQIHSYDELVKLK